MESHCYHQVKDFPFADLLSTVDQEEEERPSNYI